MLSQAVILAGGQGMRLRPLTTSLPKPMLPVLNRPFLEHTLAYLKNYGVSHAVLATSYLPEMIQGCLGDGSGLGIGLSYTVEASPLGTAGAVKNAEGDLAGTFAVLNGDIFSSLDLRDMFRFHRERGARVTIALTRVDNPSAFGVVEIAGDGRVRRFIEKPRGAVTSRWINAGVYIIEPEVMGYVPRDLRYMFERELFPRLISLGEPVYGYPFSGYWLDMGTPGKYLKLNCDLLLGKVASHLTLNPEVASYPEDAVIHTSARLSGSIVVGSRSRLEAGVSVSGPVVLGEGCHIGEGAALEETVVWSGLSIEPGARLKQCIVCPEGRGQLVVRCGT